MEEYWKLSPDYLKRRPGFAEWFVKFDFLLPKIQDHIRIPLPHKIILVQLWKSGSLPQVQCDFSNRNVLNSCSSSEENGVKGKQMLTHITKYGWQELDASSPAAEMSSSGLTWADGDEDDNKLCAYSKYWKTLQ